MVAAIRRTGSVCFETAVMGRDFLLLFCPEKTRLVPLLSNVHIGR